MRNAVSIAIVVALGTAAPTWASWEYTSWGMTREKVVAASNGAVQLDESGEPAFYGETRLPHGATGTHSWQGASFKARFYFHPRTNGLAMVVLELKNYSRQRCTALRKALHSFYGTPAGEADNPGYEAASWGDSKNDNVVNFRHRYAFIDTPFCSVDYSPRVGIND
jgi:hypothetical protein